MIDTTLLVDVFSVARLHIVLLGEKGKVSKVPQVWLQPLLLGPLVNSGSLWKYVLKRGLCSERIILIAMQVLQLP